MCAADRISETDVEEAYACGREAVRLANEGVSGMMVSIQRESSSPYRYRLGTVPLAEVAIKAKPMPDEFIDEENLYVTNAFLEYVRPLVGPLPEYVRLTGHRVQAGERQ
jgi:6-phosphofructokinase 1